MAPGVGSRVTVSSDGSSIVIKPVEGPGGFRVSAKGQLELRGDGRSLLEGGEARHYWLELHDDQAMIIAHPYK